jgi:hypothetical protein
MTRLADQLLAAVGSFNDAGLAGAIGLLAPSLARAECFEMSNDIRSACAQVSKSKPSSIVSALALTRLPYAKTWVEWQGGDPDRDPATDTKRAPARMGCLLEAFDPTLSRGLMNWAWSHAGQPPESALMVLPYSFLFDWRQDADLPQQINAIVEAELPKEEKNRRLVEIGVVPDADGMQQMLQAGTTIDQAVEFMRASKNWAHLAADPKEQTAILQMDHHGILQPSLYCWRLWEEAAKLPHFDALRHGWFDDIEGEPAFIQAFFVMLNAKGAITAQKDDLSRLNKSRAGKGRPPLREFVVTRLNLSKGMVNRAGARGMSREAARLHLVRGHFKVRKTGIYWWSPFPRGRGDVAARQRYEVAAR